MSKLTIDVRTYADGSVGIKVNDPNIAKCILSGMTVKFREHAERDANDESFHEATRMLLGGMWKDAADRTSDAFLELSRLIGDVE